MAWKAVGRRGRATWTSSGASALGWERTPLSLLHPLGSPVWPQRCGHGQRSWCPSWPLSPSGLDVVGRGYWWRSLLRRAVSSSLPQPRAKHCVRAQAVKAGGWEEVAGLVGAVRRLATIKCSKQNMNVLITPVHCLLAAHSSRADISFIRGLVGASCCRLLFWPLLVVNYIHFIKYSTSVHNSNQFSFSIFLHANII